MNDRNDTATNPEQLGNYVRTLRNERGLSVRRLAEIARLDFSWLARLERGEYQTPDARLLWRLARTLDIEPADLYVAAGYRDAGELPAFAPYLRAKYDLPPDAVAELARHFELLGQRYQSSEEGGDDGRNPH